MRKQYKNKRRCCALCKGRKRGHSNRWSPKERAKLVEFDRERRLYAR